MGNTTSTTDISTSEFYLAIGVLAREGRCEELSELIKRIQKLRESSAKTPNPYRREDYLRDVSTNYQAFRDAALGGHLECLKVLRDAGVQDIEDDKIVREIVLDAVVNDDREVIKFMADFPYAVFGLGSNVDDKKQKALRRDVMFEASEMGNYSLIEFLFNLGFLSISLERKRGLVVDMKRFDTRPLELMEPIFRQEEHLQIFKSERERNQTKTESTSYSSTSQPVLRLANYDINTSTTTCFDMYAEFENLGAREYLERDPDHLIIVFAPEIDKENRRVVRGEAVCQTKTLLRTFLKDKLTHLTECVAVSNDEVEFSRDAPFYVKFFTPNFSAFIPRENLKQAIESNDKVFCLVPLKDERTGRQAVLNETIAYGVVKGSRRAEGRNFNNCGENTSISLYKFVKCSY